VTVAAREAGTKLIARPAATCCSFSSFLKGKDDKIIAGMANESPLERLGTPNDIAELVAFLASPAGHWVDGQVIRINGGIV
jgi:NAD(P)-dependent dehydrogenase (short-subunit alcohol dehydrogenase family)